MELRPGGYSPIFWVGVCRHYLKTLTLIKETNVEKHTLVKEFSAKMTPFLRAFSNVEGADNVLTFNKELEKCEKKCVCMKCVGF